MKVLKYLSIALIFCNSIFAGTTGKLSGKVTDKETGEPLLGVNVVIQDTKLGASTDVNGDYYILNIPPGIYSVKATMIGYATMMVEQVRIQVDLTTSINIQLSSSSIQVNSEVVVIGKKEIQKDLTSSERTIQADQIQALPVRDVTSLLSMEAGITRDANGDIHIRGGRTTEISYMVDGVQVLNPVNRSSGIQIDDQSIEELKAITGTFNAEYGQALSGVVNIVTKKGSDKFSASATAYIGDNFSLDDNVYYVMDNSEWAYTAANALNSRVPGFSFDFSKYGITTYQQFYEMLNAGNKPWETKKAYLNNYDPIKHYDVQLNLSGPVPGTNKIISYFIAGRYRYAPGSNYGKRYFMPWGIWQPAMDTIHQFEMPDQKIVPLDWYRGFSTQSKVFFSLGDLTLSYGLYYNKDLSYNSDPNFTGLTKYRPDGGRNYFTDIFTHIVSATYVFSNSTFLDFKGSYYLNKHKNYLYEDINDPRYMPTNAGDFQQYVFNPTQEDNVEVKNPIYDFSYWGNDVGRTNNTTKYFSYSLDLTSQIDKNNLIKLGASGRMHDLQQESYNLQFSQVDYRPLVPDIASAYHQYYAAKPKEFAAYIQDKIEFEELIINVGVRFDYFNSDGRILSDPADPQIYAPYKLSHIFRDLNNDGIISPDEQIESNKQTVDERLTYWYKKVDAKTQVSPRFGLSFPITDRGVIHFSYGHFFQNPEFQYLYVNPNFWVEGAGAQNLVGNANLNAERTVMYEIGLQQQLFDNLYLHITGFYRDIRDWVGSGYPIDTYLGKTYYSYINRENAVARGITLSADYSIENLSLRLDYTYMNATGTASNPQDAYNALNSGQAPVVKLINLDWDQPHALNLIANYTQGSWSAVLIGSLNSGFPYTPTLATSEATGASSYTGWQQNSERRPITINLDLRLSKLFNLGDINLQAMIDITNLLDTRNARFVYSDTGLPDFTLNAYQLKSRLLEISSADEFFTNPGYYSAPRYISLGLRLSYN